MTTKLEMLNHMLNVIGEAPVSSVTSQHPTAISALVVLNGTSKEVQARGWWFNTEYGLTLLPNNVTGQIIIPSGTLYIDPTDVWSHLVRRGGKLYDPVNHTYNIGESVIVNAVLQIDEADLPETCALYIKHRAAYEFYVNDDGDETKSNRLMELRDKAWAELQQENLKAADVNSNNRPITALLRSRIRQYGYRGNPNLPGGGQ